MVMGKTVLRQDSSADRGVPASPLIGSKRQVNVKLRFFAKIVPRFGQDSTKCAKSRQGVSVDRGLWGERNFVNLR